MQVIDIPSSPEPSGSSMTRRTHSASRQSSPPKKRPRLAVPAREPSVIEIIELTDSDSERPMHRAPKKWSRKAGPSQPTSGEPVTFGKPNAELLADAPAPTPGPSQNGARPEQQHNGEPLFLPGSDDEQHVVHPPPVPASQGVPSAAPTHPQPLPPSSPAPPAPAPAPAPAPVDPVDGYIASVLEIVPDVQPTHALALIEQLMQSQPGNVVEFVLHALFENPSYPKVDKKGKHKRDEPEGDNNARASPRPKVDYTSKERVYNCGPHYFERSLVRDSM